MQRPAYSGSAEQVVRGPFTGLVDTPTPDLLRDTDASLCQNFHLDRMGITKRLGRYLWCNCGGEIFGVYQFRKSDGTQQLLAVAKYIGGAGVPVGRLLDISSPGNPLGAVSGVYPPTSNDNYSSTLGLCSFVSYNDALYMSDSHNAERYTFSPGTIGAWGYSGGAMTAPTDVSSAGGGSLVAGKFYGVAYVYRDPVAKLTTNPSDRLVINPSNTLENITIPSFAGYQARFTQIDLYRTLQQPDSATAADATLFFEKTVSTTVTSGSFPISTTVSVADSALGDAAVTDNGPAPVMIGLCLFQERIFGFRGSHVYFSKLGTDESGVMSFPPLNDIPVELNAGDDITGLFVLQGQLYCLKRSAGVFLLSPFTAQDGSLQFNVQKVTSDWGCVSYQSVIVVGNMAYWIDMKGAVQFDGTNLRSISDPAIRTTFLSYRATGRFDEIVGISDRQPDKSYCRWLVPRTVGGVIKAHDHLIFDFAAQSWFTERAGGDPLVNTDSGLFEKCFGLYRDSSQLDWVYSGDAYGNIYRFRTDQNSTPIYSDNGYAIDAHYLTKLFGGIYYGRGSVYESEYRHHLAGGGVDAMLPLKLDIEYERSAAGKTKGYVHVEFYRDGFDNAPHVQLFPLYDATANPAATAAWAMNLNRKPCSRYGGGIRHSDVDGDVSVVLFRFRMKELGRTLRGR